MHAILYARFSPRPGASDSIENQYTDLAEWCSNHDIPERDRFADPDTSGTVELWDRPGLTAAMKELRKGDVLVVRNLNRIARDASVALYIDRYVHESRKARLATIEDGGLVTDDSQGRLFRGMRYLMAEYERHEINKRTSRRMRQKQAAGEAMSKRPPIGKRIVDGKLVDNPEEVNAIEHARLLREQGYSFGFIADELEKSYPSRERKWHRSTVQRMLKKKRA